MRRGFLVPVCIVEHKFVVLDILGDAVNFYFGLMYLNARVKATNCVDLTLRYLLFEERPFTHADTDIHLIRTDMLESPSD